MSSAKNPPSGAQAETFPGDEIRSAPHGIPKARRVTLTDAPYLFDDDPDGRHPRQKLIVLCDGTWKSEQIGGALTNVALLAHCIQAIDSKGVRQVTDYQPGLGTKSGYFSFAGNWEEGVTGAGLYEAIREAYNFIARNYHDNRDEIFLVGFSRGAFTARATAQFIHEAGLLTRNGLVHVLELFKLWKEQSTKLASFKSELKAKDFLREGVMIEACAVWDTVSSLGFPRPGFLPQPAPQHLKFVNSKPSPNVRLNFQALSLQERRRHFHPIVIQARPGEQAVQQCWFLGYHSDIGGGTMDNALSVFPLIWIMSKLGSFLTIDIPTMWPINTQYLRGIIEPLFATHFGSDAVSDANPNADINLYANDDADAGSNGGSASEEALLPREYRASLADIHERLWDIVDLLKLRGLLELSFKEKRSTGGYKGRIKDSMSGIFKTGGSWHRMPCRDLYSDEGPYQLGPQEENQNQEKIHWSVRTLIDCGAIRDDEPPLKNAEPGVPNLRAVWFSDHVPTTWRFKDKEKWWKPWKFEKETWWKIWQYKRERPDRCVQEDKLEKNERYLLAHWFCYELTMLERETAKDLASQLLSQEGFVSWIGAVLETDGNLLAFDD